MKRMVIASDSSRNFVIDNDDFEYAGNGSWRYHDEDGGYIVELYNEGDGMYSLIGQSTSYADSGNDYYYDLLQTSYSLGPNLTKNHSSWFVDSSIMEDFDGPIEDIDDMGKIKVPGWFIDKCKELKEYDDEVIALAYDLDYDGIDSVEEAKAKFDYASDSMIEDALAFNAYGEF